MKVRQLRLKPGRLRPPGGRPDRHRRTQGHSSMTWPGAGDRIGLVRVNGFLEQDHLPFAARPHSGSPPARRWRKPAIESWSADAARVSPRRSVQTPDRNLGLEAVRQIPAASSQAGPGDDTYSRLPKVGFTGRKQWTPVGDLRRARRRLPPDPAAADGCNVLFAAWTELPTTWASIWLGPAFQAAEIAVGRVDRRPLLRQGHRPGVARWR